MYLCIIINKSFLKRKRREGGREGRGGKGKGRGGTGKGKVRGAGAAAHPRHKDGAPRETERDGKAKGSEKGREKGRESLIGIPKGQPGLDNPLQMCPETYLLGESRGPE